MCQTALAKPQSAAITMYGAGWAGFGLHNKSVTNNAKSSNAPNKNTKMRFTNLQIRAQTNELIEEEMP